MELMRANQSYVNDEHKKNSKMKRIKTAITENKC